MQLPTLSEVRIGLIGLGYVGLPLAAYLARRYPVIGFDINAVRIAELQNGTDRTREVTDDEMRQAKGLSFSTSPASLAACNFFIVTVPTPINQARQPDLTACCKASETVGALLRPGRVVVYESTVYPGATEEVFVPILEQKSGLKLNRDFAAGYSPERINPGDQARRLPNILKITSGSTPEAADLINEVYASVITAGTHRASSIRVAEAAKVIENVQRDLNIALVNELAQLFKRLDIETREVLEAAGTKWNFHGYRPGLVGGHCIGVDPYYLTHKAESVGFHPQVVLAGRRVNDGMSTFIVHDIVRTMVERKLPVGAARLLVMGFTFKENCPDVRNTKVATLVSELAPFAEELVTYDPLADPAEVMHQYGLKVVNELPEGKFDGIVLAVSHDAIREIGSRRMRAMLTCEKGFIYDIKEVLPISESDRRL